MRLEEWQKFIESQFLDDEPKEEPALAPEPPKSVEIDWLDESAATTSNASASAIEQKLEPPTSPNSLPAAFTPSPAEKPQYEVGAATSNPIPYLSSVTPQPIAAVAPEPPKPIEEVEEIAAPTPEIEAITEPEEVVFEKPAIPTPVIETTIIYHREPVTMLNLTVGPSNPLDIPEFASYIGRPDAIEEQPAVAIVSEEILEPTAPEPEIIAQESPAHEAAEAIAVPAVVEPEPVVVAEVIQTEIVVVSEPVSSEPVALEAIVPELIVPNPIVAAPIVKPAIAEPISVARNEPLPHELTDESMLEETGEDLVALFAERKKATAQSKANARRAKNIVPQKPGLDMTTEELWASVPKHMQTLLALDLEDEREIAQNSYKRPFDENRRELIARLLDPVLSLEDAARLLNVCPTTVRRYTNKGILTHYRAEPENPTENKANPDKETRQRRFRLSDILAFLEAQQSASPSINLTTSKAATAREETK